jgi:dihydropteroate synthase
VQQREAAHLLLTGAGEEEAHNPSVVGVGAALDQFAALGVPLLAGLSRKAMIGTLTGRERHADRAAGSAAAALLAVQKGAAIVRVHDVAATRDALAVWEAVANGFQPVVKAPKAFGSQRFEDD